MKRDVLSSPEAAARAAAFRVAAHARAAAAARGRFVLALSGGTTPWPMLRALADEDVPWEAVYVAQVDERVAPAGDPERNLTHLRQTLLGPTPLREEQLLAMPVEGGDLDAAAADYARRLEALAGTPPRLDLVHLGLGADGHTASLVPDDPVLEVRDRDVATTGPYRGRRRMTLTFPVLERARALLWLVCGEEKEAVLPALLRRDPGLPAGRVSQARALLVADRAAAARCSGVSGHAGRVVLAVDVGGSHVKVRTSDDEEVRRFRSGPQLGAAEMVAHVKRLAADWRYDVVSVGYPGPVLHGKPVAEPANLGPGWVGFDFAAAFGCPLRLVNDAAMQALGSYQGGRMLFLGLGTGLGSALVVDGRVEPLELGHLPYKKSRSYEDYVGQRGLKRLGPRKWRKAVADVVDRLTAAVVADDVVLGGGNARKLHELPPGTRLGDNANAFTGGFLLWREDVG